MIQTTQDGKSKITGVVLAGGQSRRFGRDKGVYLYKGKPLVLRAVDSIRPLCDEILVSTNNPEAYTQFGLPLIADIFQGCGPLGGIHSGLTHAHHNTVLFIACDTPNVPVSIYHVLLNNMHAHDAIMPAHGNYIETLCAVYHKRCLPQIKESLKNGVYKILDAHNNMNVRYFPVGKEDFYSPEIFHNINYQNDA